VDACGRGAPSGPAAGPSGLSVRPAAAGPSACTEWLTGHVTGHRRRYAPRLVHDRASPRKITVRQTVHRDRRLRRNFTHCSLFHGGQDRRWTTGGVRPTPIRRRSGQPADLRRLSDDGRVLNLRPPEPRSPHSPAWEMVPATSPHAGGNARPSQIAHTYQGSAKDNYNTSCCARWARHRQAGRGVALRGPDAHRRYASLRPALPVPGHRWSLTAT